MNTFISTIQPTQSKAEQLRPVVRQWVGQSFFGPMLKEARNTSLASEDSPFSGGRGGNAFGSLMDGHLSEAAGRGTGGQLADAIVRQLAGGDV